ncbi:MAG: primosomal protein N' [Planctomycetes bacterium]|nr:primosomal protein N' [Planctomycetota bacterium]
MSSFQGDLFGAPKGRFARVALNTPVRREFSYCVPEAFESELPLDAGCRVRVPFGSREVVGVVVGVDPAPPEGVPASRMRSVATRLDEQPLLTPALLRLARGMSDRTFCSWGQALAAMMPAALRKARPRRTVPVVEFVEKPPEADYVNWAKRWPKQERALAYLEKAGGAVQVREFLNRTGLSRSPLDTLAKKGWVKFGKRQEVIDPFAGKAVAIEAPHQATAHQQVAMDALCDALDAREHQDFLLFGITGSGKTEVYLRALERCLKQGRGAIILVPEISLTPQTVSRFRARCGEVAVLHSGLTDAERHDQWVAIREGRVRVVVGARSALFAPVPDLGLIILDEEHESSFKQESVPRYHARDTARERAHLEGAVCVLGSATPSLESWALAGAGRITKLNLPERVAGGELPAVKVVDMRQQKAERGNWLVVSQPLRVALDQELAAGNQAILFLNQRGFSPAWHCKQCGGSVHCEQCDVALTYHKWRRKALCHYCLAESPPPRACPKCNNEVSMVGAGTERVEDTVQRMFPEARIARMDRDTMLRRESYEELLGAFGRQEFDILLGTQMVAKGLDFPHVTLVGVLNADTALHQPDFRSSERAFNLIAQVAGRAGRSSRGGRVIVQTWMPEHASIVAAAHHDYPRFAALELKERELFGYPPYGLAMRLMFEAGDRKKADQLAAESLTLIRNLAGKGVRLLGPLPHPMERLRGRWRRQMLIKTNRQGLRDLQPALFELCQKTGVTVDPL